MARKVKLCELSVSCICLHVSNGFVCFRVIGALGPQQQEIYACLLNISNPSGKDYCLSIEVGRGSDLL